VASQNYAANNHGTGYIADGKFWNFSDNAASNNNLTGMALAFCNSAIIGNKAVGNNTALLTTGMHQISVSGDVACGDNLVLNNRTDTMGHPGSGIYAGGDGSTLISNAEATGADWIGPSNLSQSNSDGAGLLPATQYTASIVSAGNEYRHGAKGLGCLEACLLGSAGLPFVDAGGVGPEILLGLLAGFGGKELLHDADFFGDGGTP
jgi:hypothetical protein